MVNQKPKISIEAVFYIAAFIIAFCFRLMKLGDLPLGDQEAKLALQAWDLSRVGQSAASGTPGYLSLTTGLFFLFGGSNWLARIIPVIAGTLLVFTPILFRKLVGRETALILAFLFVFDPILVASSRQVDGRIIAILALFATMGFLLHRDVPKAGIMLGYSILCGVTFWQGMLGLSLAWLLMRAFRFDQGMNDQVSEVGIYDTPATDEKVGFNLKQLMMWAVGTLFVIGSLFFIKPALLGGAAEGLSDFIKGYFGGYSGISLSLLLVAWLVSNPLGLILATFETIKVIKGRDRTGLFLVLWWLIAVVLAFINPARQAVDLALPALPMLVLSARYLVRIFQLRGEKVAFFAYATLSFVILASVWLNAIGLVSSWNDAEQNSRLAALLASVFLLLAVTFLVIWGWGTRVTGKGFRLGGTAILLLMTLSTAWRAAGLGTLPENEIFRIDSYVKDQALLSASLDDFSLWKTGGAKALDMGVIGLESPALAWVLRLNPQVTYAEGFSNNPPSLLITIKKTDLGINAPYSGQALTWNSEPDWPQFSTSQWLRWLAFRDAPLVKQTIQLWVRTDVFPGASTISSGQ